MVKVYHGPYGGRYPNHDQVPGWLDLHKEDRCGKHNPEVCLQEYPKTRELWTLEEVLWKTVGESSD